MIHIEGVATLCIKVASEDGLVLDGGPFANEPNGLLSTTHARADAPASNRTLFRARGDGQAYRSRFAIRVE
eukprot:7391918-Prymnesium_polylepis.4